MIAVNLVGRIGNQLFIYAAAEAIRQRRGRNEKIVFYDESILAEGWKNSLMDYPLENVEYVHDKRQRPWITKLQSFIASRFYQIIGYDNLDKIYHFEKRLQPFLNKIGIISCLHGYVEVHTPTTKNVFIRGYLQSDKYFLDIQPKIKQLLKYHVSQLIEKDYVQQLINRNAICISIKVEHNADNPLFDVCGKEYYTEAIKYVTQRIEKPLFFICSDNVEYVLEHFIDANNYDYLCQEKGLAVSDSLTIMSLCKHFIIGNTSFGWWAQFLSENNEKIVIAPNKWFRDPHVQADQYQEGWHLIDVKDYIEKH